MAGTSTDVAVLSAASNCFSTLNSNQLLAIQTYLLCQILAGGGGGGGSPEVFSLPGATTPVTAPVSGAGVAYNVAGQFWGYSSGSWVLLFS